MAITLIVSDNTTADFKLTDTNEAVLLEANNSGVTLTAEESESISMSVESAEVTLTAEASTYISDTDYYTGLYEVTPKAYDEQILETAHKMMADNVTVHVVPYYEASNATGDTVYIASEVN